MQTSIFDAATVTNAATAAIDSALTEEHDHNVAIWFGQNGATPGEDYLTPYTCTSGNNAFGAATPVLFNVNTPIRAGKTYFDVHKVAPLAVSSATAYLMRFIFGSATTSVAQAEAAYQYTTVELLSTGTGSGVKSSAIEFRFPHLPAGWWVQAKCKNATNNATITFLVGLHEYPATEY